MPPCRSDLALGGPRNIAFGITAGVYHFFAIGIPPDATGVALRIRFVAFPALPPPPPPPPDTVRLGTFENTIDLPADLVSGYDTGVLAVGAGCQWPGWAARSAWRGWCLQRPGSSADALRPGPSVCWPRPAHLPCCCLCARLLPAGLQATDAPWTVRRLPQPHCSSTGLPLRGASQHSWWED